MKRSTSAFLLAAVTAAYMSPAFSRYYSTPFPRYVPPSAIYVTVGGGVTWVEHEDFYRHPITSTQFFSVRQPSTSDNVVGSVNAAIGYQFHIVPIRAEVAYRWIDDADYKWEPLFVEFAGHNGFGSIGSQAVLFNLYYDFYNRTRFTPFIGGSIGYAYHKSTFTVTETGIPQDNTNNDFAWGGTVGVKYEITSNFFIDVRAEYLSLGEVQINENFQTVNTGIMKTNDLYTISGLVNITYAYNFL